MEVSIGRIPCIIVDDHVAIKVEIDGAADIDQYQLLLRQGSFNERILMDNRRWIQIVWRLDSYDMQR